MELTINGHVALSHAHNISRMIGTHLFNKEQLVGFFTWLDGQIRNSKTSSEKAESIRNIVGAAPYAPYTSLISARHPNYLSDYKHRKTRDLPDEVHEVFSALFRDDRAQPYGRYELVGFLDSMIALIGYDLEEAGGIADRDDLIEILEMAMIPDIKKGVRARIEEMKMADPVTRACGVPV